MTVCNPTCVTTIPRNDWANRCNISTRTGGIPYMTFLKCDPNFDFPNPDEWVNLDNVLWAICNEFLFVTAKLLGQKPKGSFTKRRMTSCGPEETVSGEKTFTFQDYNADKDTLIDFDFWGSIVDNKKFMSFGYITCDERWYQTTAQWDIEVDEVIEDNNQGKSFYDGTIAVQQLKLLKPILVPGIINVIESFDSTYC